MEIEQETSRPLGLQILRGIAMLLGLVAIGLGLWALGGAIVAAWALYENPDNIAHFATYFLETTKVAAMLPSAGEGLAHYLAWILVVLLLLVLGKLGAWALGAGAMLFDRGSRK